MKRVALCIGLALLAWPLAQAQTAREPTGSAPPMPAAAPRPAPPAATASPIAPAPSPPTLPGAPLPATPVAAPADAEPGELLFIDENLAQAQQRQALLQADGLRLLRRQVLGTLGGVLSTYRAPDEARYRRWQTPPADGEANHRYRPLSDADTNGPAGRSRQLVRWPTERSACGAGVRIGLIDGPVDARHALLEGARVEAVSLLPQGVAAASAEHGTAVASVLVGQGETPGLVRRARLFAVAVLRARDGEVDTTAEWLIRALDRQAGAQVVVINMSLGGPPNRWLGETLARVQARGIALVAAAGNGGAHSAPRFPATHPAVLAVTAVDLAERIDVRAPRGEAIALAAPGVDLPLAAPGGGIVYRSGSSFAAPFVSAALAMGLSADALRQGARDLGAPGRDPVYGWGLLQVPAACSSPR
jgi:hypothetical protein